MDLFGHLSTVEEPLFRALDKCGTNPVLDVLFVALTVFGASYVLVWVIPATWFCKRKEAAFDIAIVLLIVSAIVELLKYATQRERPLAVLDDVNTISAWGFAEGSGLAFPSGHAARAFAVATSFAFIVKKPVAIPLFIVAVLIGVSRIYLGLHWPSDIVAGAAAGIVIAYFVHCAGLRWPLYVRARSSVVGLLSRCGHREKSVQAPSSDSVAKMQSRIK